MTTQVMERAEKPARLDLKTNTQFKAQLEEAAALSGVNLTAFILSAAAEKVREVKMFHSHTILASDAFDRLTNILDKPQQAVTPQMAALFAEDNLGYGKSM